MSKKRKKKSPLKGRPSSKVSKLRSIEHLDPQSKTHHTDKKTFSKVREKAKKSQEVDLVNINPLLPLKFPSLGGGSCVDRELNILSSTQHRDFLEKISRQRSYYNSHSTNKDGERRCRRRETIPLQQLAVTFRPDFAITFEHLENEKSTLLESFLFHKVLPIIFEEFECATGLEIIAAQIHPEEGMLHFHITYTHVSAELELLWPKSGSGRRGLRLLGPSSVGVLRLATAGFLSNEVAEKANQYLKYRTEEMEGDTPVDLKLAYALDGLCTHFFEQKDFHPHWVKSAVEYSKDLGVRLNERPKFLKESNELLKNKIRELEEEISNLKAAEMKMPNQHAPLLERLAFLPNHILHGADSFADITNALLAQGDQTAMGYLNTLAYDMTVPLTSQERADVQEDLKTWYRSSDQDFGVDSEKQ